MMDQDKYRPPLEGRPEVPFWLTPVGARIALIALHVAAVAVVVFDWIRPLSTSGHGVERLRALDFVASYALFGFVACVALVLLGRVLRQVVMRGEDYYRDSEP